MVDSGKKIKAITQEAGAGGPETLGIGEIEIPRPKENEVLIKVKYSAVNRADIMQVCMILGFIFKLERREVSFSPRSNKDNRFRMCWMVNQ